jgi:hypothetical protein
MTALPSVKCVICRAMRSCQMHTRARNPIEAAKIALRRLCDHRGACNFTVRPSLDTPVIQSAVPRP